MNATSSIVVSVLIASAAAAGITLAMQPEREAGPSPQFAQLEATLSELREQNAALQKQVEELSLRPAQVATPAVERTEAPTLSTAQVAAAVEAYLRSRGGADAAEAAVASEPATFDLERDFAELAGTSYWENPEAWKRAFAAGKMDEVIEQLEGLAAAEPNNLDAKMALASGYLAYLQMDQSKFALSMKADEQFDNVLAIDGNHWEARFTKAMSYTFWPEFTGKRTEAVGHFETLMKQQESLPVQDHHAQTYLILGNMLAERDPARAKEIWAKGLARHPQNAELLQKSQ